MPEIHQKRMPTKIYSQQKLKNIVQTIFTRDIKYVWTFRGIGYDITTFCFFFSFWIRAYFVGCKHNMYKCRCLVPFLGPWPERQ